MYNSDPDFHSSSNGTDRRRKDLRKRISPLWYIIISFAALCLLGALLLFIPYASSDPDNSLSFIDSFFLSVSAVCVTGLTPVNISEVLSLYGKIVLCILIQLGGLGIVTVVSFVVFATGKKFDISQTMVVKEALAQPGFGHLKPMVKHIIIITAGFELFGTVLNFFVFFPSYPFWEAVGMSVFHAVSSFNNAGFDLIGAASMVPYADNILLNFSTCFLIIAGGIGYLVLEDLFSFHRYRSFSIQTKIVLVVNGVILVSLVLLVFGLEYPKMSFMEAVFYAVNLRTAGFTTVDNKAVLTQPVIIISMIAMFIGGSPLSTAGGIKTTSFFVIVASLYSFARGRKTVTHHRTIDHYTKLKAFFLLFIGLTDVLLSAILVSILDGGAYSLDDLLYVCFSAFANVGLDVGVTPLLSIGSKIVICCLMFIGRVGPAAFLAVWNPTLYRPKKSEVSYLGMDLMIG